MPPRLGSTLDELGALVDEALQEWTGALRLREAGTVVQVGEGVARIRGLARTRSEELLRFADGTLGIAFNLDEDEIGVVLLGQDDSLSAGSSVRRTGRVVDVPVGDELLGRVIDATGRPLDEKGPLRAQTRLPVERRAPAIMDRAPVAQPLQTGIKAVDALIPVGRGQRELIVGDRQTGKTAVAVDTLINQRDSDVIGIYCAIGQRGAAVAQVIQDLRSHRALGSCVVLYSSGDDPPGLQFVTPYAAFSVAEFFMEKGRDVVVVLDDLTRHARAYRELSLLLRRPPGREAYPGDIFYIHSRLLERATHLREDLGGGSITALPIVETEEQNISAYIPTNLISITDGQIYLSPELFRKGHLPAIDVGKSVSRVGGKAQLPAYRAVAGDLRLSYSQFEELETFSRFGTRLDEETRRRIERGRRVREILKQPQYALLKPTDQIVVLLALSEGLFDDVALDDISSRAAALREAAEDPLEAIRDRIESGEALSDEDREALVEFARRVLQGEGSGAADGDA
ncbi:MAG: alternate F1F0 ATPase, F1 subunit alpha [bacterium]